MGILHISVYHFCLSFLFVVHLHQQPPRAHPQAEGLLTEGVHGRYIGGSQSQRGARYTEFVLEPQQRTELKQILRVFLVFIYKSFQNLLVTAPLTASDPLVVHQ